MSVGLPSGDLVTKHCADPHFSYLSKGVLQQDAMLQIVFLNFLSIDTWFSNACVCRKWKQLLSPLILQRVNLKIYLDTSGSMTTTNPFNSRNKNSFLQAKDAINDIATQCLLHIGKLELYSFSSVVHEPQNIKSASELSEALSSLKCRDNTSYDFLEAILWDSVDKGKNNLLFRQIIFITDWEVSRGHFNALLSKLTVINTVANLQLVLINVGREREPEFKKVFDQEKEKGLLKFVTWRNFPSDPIRPKQKSLQNEEINPLPAKKLRRSPRMLSNAF